MKQIRMYLMSATAFAVSSISMSAHAALPPSVATWFTDILADVTSLNALAFPVVLAVLGFFVILRLVKRFGNRV